MDSLIDIESFRQKNIAERIPAMNEEIELMKLRATREKSALEHSLDDIRTRAKALEQDADNATDRIRQMTAKKELTVLQRELREREERLFFDCMRIDTAYEDQVSGLTSSMGWTVKSTRQFVIKVTGGQSG